jgi:hypothetical protein
VATAAGQTARSITDPYWQAQALAEVAGALAQAGQHDRAEQTARSITDPDQQAQTLAKVAGALAEAGQHDRAEQTARSITDPDRQAQALADVARTLAQAGDAQVACRVTAAACVAGSRWTVAVESALRAQPSVCATVTDLGCRTHW